MSTPSSIPRLAQLGRPNLREQARSVLRASIVTGELEPGVLYTVGAFAERLGVSATPVREALGDLAQVGLVELIRNRGFTVPALTDHDLDEIFEIRLMLEPPGLVEVADKLTAKDIEACRRLVVQGKEAATAGDLTRFLEADRELHLRLIRPLANRRLNEILGRLRDETRLYGLRELVKDGLLVASAEEHERLLDAVEVGDVNAMRDEMTRHLSHTRGAWAARSECTD